MTYKLQNGDYVCNGNTLETCEYIDEAVQNATLMLFAKRGRFYPNKDFGSLLRVSDAAPRLPWALAFANQALSEMDGVFVRDVLQQNNQLVFVLHINGNERRVVI